MIAEPEGHDQERDAEAGLLGEWLKVAVRKLGDRELEGVRRRGG